MFALVLHNKPQSKCKQITRFIEPGFCYRHGYQMHKIPFNWNCPDQFREIPWNQTMDVHRGSTLITRVIM